MIEMCVVSKAYIMIVSTVAVDEELDETGIADPCFLTPLMSSFYFLSSSSLASFCSWCSL
jgi:hypothetical protein